MHITDRVVLAIDIGGSKVMTGIVSSDGKVLKKERELLPFPITKEVILDTILRLCCRTLEGYDRKKVCCAAIAIPGLADSETGIWVYSSFSGIKNFPIAKELSKKLELPIFIDNDVKACALGEMWFHSASDLLKDFLWVTVSNGVGGCAVVNGEILAGTSNSAGEIGHVCVEENGYLCQCGNHGCLEAHAAGPAILKRYRERKGNTEGFEAGFGAKEIAERAARGEVEAREIFEETGYYLGKAIAVAVNILNPQKVYLGGGIAKSMDLFYPQLEKTFNSMVFKKANPNVCIEKTALGYDAALLGAAAIGFRKIKNNR